MNDITALAQRMDEVDPRDAFEKLYPLPAFCIRCGDGYASTSFNGWDANAHKSRWEGWKAAMALMESRTVTVKLPKAISVLHRMDFNDAHRSIYAYPEAELNAALADAGIQVIEGEGQ